MKNHTIISTGLTFFLLVSCSPEKAGVVSPPEAIEQQLLGYTEKLTVAEAKDDLDEFLSFYDEDAISMPEYQLTREGKKQISDFYKEIFARQNVRTFRKLPREFIHMGNTIVEIGTFGKEYTDSATDTVMTLNGKYWHVWEKRAEGKFLIKGEAYGYFHHVAKPQLLAVASDDNQPDEDDLLRERNVPFELKAYNALMEKGVRKRDGLLRTSFFTDDGSFFPFADTTVAGIDNMRAYLIAYSNRGTVSIDSIMCYTYDFENHDDYLIEYAMFKVKWTVPPSTSGRTEGKGIRIWKRQDDHSLRLYREIGTHNHIE